MLFHEAATAASIPLCRPCGDINIPFVMGQQLKLLLLVAQALPTGKQKSLEKVIMAWLIHGIQGSIDNPYATADKWLLKENLPVSYRQQVVEFILQNTGQRNFSLDASFRDPYTGGSAYIPGEPSVPFDTHSTFGCAPKPTFKHIPKEQKSLSLTELELSRLAAIVKILKDASHYHCNKFADADIVLLLKILKSWPLSMIFPVIDIVRMIILHPDGATLLHKHIENGNDTLLETFKRATAAPAQAANILTMIRAITNLFKHSYFSSWLQSHYSEGPVWIHLCGEVSQVGVWCYAVLLVEIKDKEGQAQVLSAALEIAEDGNQDVDSGFRALVAIGSLMLDGLVKSIAIDLDVQSVANDAKASMESKIAEVGADIELIIKAA
ncbi:phospholipase A-2-activating protein-like [Cocos nucifera]|uniref:Phospholipase A-2-activating protein-like n=1 Tax=Cocos nucifera TaxID=13894 RepID=A0A8K0ID85_COCNU|nr:phospholipase A-2-activating protein-like [Cocos nucifera]